MRHDACMALALITTLPCETGQHLVELFKSTTLAFDRADSRGDNLAAREKEAPERERPIPGR